MQFVLIIPKPRIDLMHDDLTRPKTEQYGSCSHAQIQDGGKLVLVVSEIVRVRDL